MNLVLFDIDYTILKGVKVHGDAFDYAFKKVYGADISHKAINCQGMVDTEIIYKVLRLAGLNDSEIKLRFEECVSVICEYYDKNKYNEHLIVLPGVKELFKALKGKVIIGLLTGNIEHIAHGKLMLLGIDDFIQIGGYGLDSDNRTGVAKAALKKAKNIADIESVFVFGDTPKDIIAGHSIGAKAIAVMTGKYGKNELKHADYILKDLTDTKK